MSSSQNNKLSILLIIYFLVVFGYTFSLGFYYLPSFLVLTIAFLLLLTFYFLPRLFENLQPLDFNQMLKFGLLINVSLSLVAYGGLQQEKAALYNLSLVLLMISVLGVLSYFFEKAPVLSISNFNHLNFGFVSNFGFRISNFLRNLWRHRLALLILIALILRILMVFSSPQPAIDVFDILKNGPKALLQGKNPYSLTFNRIYNDAPANYFAYPPGILILATPFVILFGDPRYLFILVEILSAIIIYSVIKKASRDELAQTVSLLFLFNPRWSLMLEQSWIDTLAVLIFSIILLLQTQKRLSGLAWSLTGFLITIKQSFLILPLLIIRSFGLKIRQMAAGLAVILLMTLPFFLWAPQAFVKRVISDYGAALSQRLPLSHRSLSFNSLWFEQTKADLPNSVLVISSLIFISLLLLKQKRGFGQFLLASTLLYFGIFMFSKMAFLNFYYFISQLLILCLTAVLIDEAKEKEVKELTS